MSLVYFGTVQVWWVMYAKLVADHSRHVVTRLQNSVILMLSFSFWTPSDIYAAERSNGWMDGWMDGWIDA